jgi:hypothetical protein
MVPALPTCQSAVTNGISQHREPVCATVTGDEATSHPLGKWTVKLPEVNGLLVRRLRETARRLVEWTPIRALAEY